MPTSPYTLDQGNLYMDTVAPQEGSGAYGMVPGFTQVAPSEYAQVGSVYPGLQAQTGQVSSNINNELMGQLSPETIAALQQHAAQFGVTSGMPGSQFAGHAGLRSLGLNVEAMQRQGQQDYLNQLKGIGSTMTPQSLATSVAEQNANLAAAPDPKAAADQQMRDWMAKFHMTSSAAPGVRAPAAFPTFNPPPQAGTMPTPAGSAPTSPADFSQADWYKSIGWNPAAGTQADAGLTADEWASVTGDYGVDQPAFTADEWGF